MTWTLKFQSGNLEVPKNDVQGSLSLLLNIIHVSIRLLTNDL